MDIKLNFVNRSSDTGNSQIVIFQKNEVADGNDRPVAWQVISHCGPGENHPFKFPASMQLSTRDSWGNYQPMIDASHGQLFEVRGSASGEQLCAAGDSSHPAQIHVQNTLAQGAISAGIYKGGKLLATSGAIAPGQKAVFGFTPNLWIGVVSQIDEGEVMDPAIVSGISAEISLMGLASADIIMTGGGAGAQALPFSFTLGNMQTA